MATIVETLNIGFVIPLIEMECALSLTLSQKGILNSAAFVGQFSSSIVDSICLRKLRSRRRHQLVLLGILRRLAARWAQKSYAFMHLHRLRLLPHLDVLGARLDADRDAVPRRSFVRNFNSIPQMSFD